MTGICRAFVAGLNLEIEWNERCRVSGYHCGTLEVPPMRYRVVRALHMGQVAVREHVAVAIAPWLDDTPANDPRIEAHLS